MNVERDFTIVKYKALLQSLQQAGYIFVPFGEVCHWRHEHPQEALPWNKYIMLRHDVDLRAANSLTTAEVEHGLGIRASYYFRVIPESNRPDIIRAIAAMGHEIGYHYEDMALAQGDTQQALAHFEQWLTYFRRFYPVKTICMHGAPTSRYDGRDLWKTADYHQYGILGEPYFDIDFREVFYLTDTGRRWDGFRVSVRDKVSEQDRWCREGKVFHTTDDIIARLPGMNLPAVMITTHPQRWTDHRGLWVRELMTQTCKNLIKRILLWAEG